MGLCLHESFLYPENIIDEWNKKKLSMIHIYNIYLYMEIVDFDYNYRIWMHIIEDSVLSMLGFDLQNKFLFSK